MKKLWIPALLVLAVGGFAVAKVMSAKKEDGRVVSEYRAIIRFADGGWFADIMKAGAIVETLGPSESEAGASQNAATYLDGLDVPAFYTLSVDDQDRWYFEGWSRGAKVLDSSGPYASEAIANAAGSKWAKSQVGAE